MHSALITVIGSHFHQTIIDKYQMDKGAFRSPPLIFLKHTGRISYVTINADVVVRLLYRLGKMLPGHTNSVQGTHGLFSQIRIEHLIRQYQQYPFEGYLTDRISLFQYHERRQQTGQVWPAHVPEVHDKGNTRIQYINPFYPDFRVLHGADRPDSPHLRQGQNMQTMQHAPYPPQHRVTMMNNVHKTEEDPSSLAGKRLMNTRTQPIHSPDFRVLHGADRPDSSHLRPGQNMQTVQHVPYRIQHRVTMMNSVHKTEEDPSSLAGKGLVNARWQRIHPFSPETRVLKQDQTFENHHHSQPAGFLPFRDRTAVSTEGKLLHFNDQQNIERKIEEVKKIAIETREAVQERSASLHASGNTDFKKHLDVHWLSDQVYQNIEQRIRMEKERRGLSCL